MFVKACGQPLWGVLTALTSIVFDNPDYNETMAKTQVKRLESNMASVREERFKPYRELLESGIQPTD